VAAAATPTFIPMQCFDRSVRPATVVVSCADANAMLMDLRWTGWGRPTARALGTLRLNLCDPDCAAGTAAEFAASATASGRTRCSGSGFQYTRLTVRYPGVQPEDTPRTLTTSFPCPTSETVARASRPGLTFTLVATRTGAGASPAARLTLRAFRSGTSRGNLLITETRVIGGYFWFPLTGPNGARLRILPATDGTVTTVVGNVLVTPAIGRREFTYGLDRARLLPID
jgi:hypothetical protein